MRPTRLNAAVLFLAVGLLTGTDQACAQEMPITPAANPSAVKREVIATSEPVPKLPPPAMMPETVPEPRSADASPNLGFPPCCLVPPASISPGAAPLPASAPTVPASIGLRAPALSLVQLGPTSVSAGRPFAYEIVVRNIGTEPAADVRVQDELPTATRFVSAEPRPEANSTPLAWNLGNLDPGMERRIKVEAVPSGDGEFVSRATATYVTSSYLRTQILGSQLALVATGPETARLGDAVPFQIQVTNNGKAPATHVVLRDRLPPGLQHPSGDFIEADLGTLSPGQTRKLTLETKAVKSGRLVSELAVTADGGGQAAAQPAVQVSEPALLLRVVAPPESFVNREMEYRLEITNAGTDPATNLRALEQLPEGLEFVAASNNGVYDPSTRGVQWALGTLSPRATRAIAVKVLARVAGNWSSRALAQADRGLEAMVETAVRVDGMPGLTAEVRDLDDPVEVGAETTYEIRVVNQGTATSDNVRVTAFVPEAMAVVAADGPTPNRVQGQQVAFERLPRLAVGANVMYRVRVRAQRAGDWRFKVSFTADHLQQPVVKEESTRVYSD